MPGKVSSSEAKSAIRRARELLEALQSISDQESVFEERVRRAVEGARSAKISAFLSDVSASEIASVLPVFSAAELVQCGIRSAADVIPEKHGTVRSGQDAERLQSFVSTCGDRLRAGLRISLKDGELSSDILPVISSAQALITYRLIEKECRRLISERQSDCKLLTSKLDVVSNPLKRLFASRNERTSAALAYEELSSLLDGDYGNRVRAQIAQYEKAKLDTDAGALSFYKSNPALFDSVVEEIVPGCLGQDDWPFSSSEANNVYYQVEGLLDNLEAADAAYESQTASIQGLIEKCLAKESIETLSNIPIEELNRDKSGIRVSALAKAGYKTIADVYTASTYALRSVRGVGDSSVLEIKRRAKQYAKEAQQGLGLRINADRRTPESTRLVTALYRYTKTKSLSCSCANLAEKARPQVSRAEEGLHIARRGIDWIFANPDQIELARRSYDEISGFVRGEYGDKARGLLKTIDRLSVEPVEAEAAWNAFVDNPIAFNDAIEAICPDAFGTSDGLYGLPEDLAREVQEECFFPDGLLCTLRRYQEWGVKYILHQGKVLLGDEMGLGKTVQAIATMVSLRNVGCTHFLVICPASVLENWCREVHRHSKLSVMKVHGYTAASAYKNWKAVGGVAVTTYETTAKLTNDDGFTYGLAIVDEAHYIKNPNAARTANVLRLCKDADRLLFMTGTALENKVEEMLTLIGDLRPDIADRAKPLAFMSGAQQFRDVIAPVYYRRKRTDVLTELPDLIENEDWCQLGSIEQNAYENALMSRNFMDIRRVSWNVEDLTNSSKARRLREVVSDAADDGRKTLVFTFFLETAWGVADMLGESCVGIINGSVPPAKRQTIIEDFDSAPAGSVLVAQIQSGGTGLNIQSASVVIICEPQFKPSIENQAISRAYRMGQARNVLVHRLLCENTVDEKMMERLKQKQKAFDAFADKSSAAAAEEPSIDSESFGKIVESEIERIKRTSDDDKTNGHLGETEGNKAGGNPSLSKSATFARSYSVTMRAKSFKQPRGGLLPPRMFESHGIDKYGTLSENENVYPNIVGMATDYLTRFRLDPANGEDAFKISLTGAKMAGKYDEALILLQGMESYAREASSEFPDVDVMVDLARRAAALSSFDVYYRSPVDAKQDWEARYPDEDTARNIWELSNRTLRVLRKYGHKHIYAAPSLNGGYSLTVSSGDADYLTDDVLWDLKVSRRAPTPIHTLQLLMYWRMGCKSLFSDWEKVKYLGIINPRLGVYYLCPTNRIGSDVIRAVEDDVLVYDSEFFDIEDKKITFDE